MKKLSKKQKLITSIVGGVLAVALIITIIMVSVSSCSDKTVYVEREKISVTVDTGVSVTMKLNLEYAVTDAAALVPGDAAYAKDLGGKMPFKVSFEKLITKLATDGKLTGAADEVILITIESIKHEDYEKILDIINKVIAEKEYKTKVITLYIRAKEAKIIQFAEKNNISYGKAYFCDKIAKESKKLKADDLATKTLAEIYRLAKEDKTESHISSVVSDLNSNQEEIEPPKKDESSSKPTSSENVSSGTSSEGETSSTPSETPSETPSDTSSSSELQGGQQLEIDTDSGWVSGWY